jgi:hypothetical protein
LTETTTIAASGSRFAGCATFRATAGLIGESLFRVEFLLGSREGKITATIPAIKRFV